MKKIVLIAAASAFMFSSSVMAQEASKIKKEKMNVEQRSTKVADRLQQELDLTDEVKAKVKALNVSKFSELKALHDKYGSEIKAHQDQTKAVREQYREALSALLTPEQLEKLKSKAKQRRAVRSDKPVKAVK